MAGGWRPDASIVCASSTRYRARYDIASRNSAALLGSPGPQTGGAIASTSYDSTICIWDAHDRKLLHRWQAGYAPALAWSPDSTLLATANENAIVTLDARTGRPTKILEGHSQEIRALSFSADGRYLASRAGYQTTDEEVDARLLLWDTASWVVRQALTLTTGRYLFTGLAFSPSGPILATSAREDHAVQVWKLDFDALGKRRPRVTPIHYKNAKVALVGDSGVGKSGLALVLTGHRFAPTDSTHARRVLLLNRCKPRAGPSGSEIRETVLWDLAGQPGYRLIHQLHLSDVTVALLLFDSRNELDPFAGVRHWNRALNQASAVGIESPNESPKKILVAARIDRGPVGAGRDRIRELLEELRIDCYCETSAKEGTGLTLLNQQISDAIDWNSLPTVSSNAFLRKIKSFLVEERRGGRRLATIGELLRAFQASIKSKRRAAAEVSRAVFEGCIQRLQCLGEVRRFSFGDLVLLQPERLDAYASSIVFAAQREPDGMGSIDENAVREGRFDIPPDDKIHEKGEERLLLTATLEDLIAHEIAFREAGDGGALLVFPSQLTRENPDLPDPAGKDAMIEFAGPVLTVYATLVVRLAHSNIFSLNEMWKNAAVFATSTTAKCGVFLTDQGDGRGILTLFYSVETPPTIRQQFEHYITAHVKRRASPESVNIRRVLVCPNPACASPVPEIAIAKRREKGFNSILCNVCESRIALPPMHETPALEPTAGTVQIDLNADHRRVFDATITSASGEMLSGRFRKWAGSNRSTLALVFTDIVGSTALGEELGDEVMSGIREVHFRTVRNLITKYKGYEVKTIGDSFMIAFRTAVEALNFCLELQRAPGDQRLAMRAGLHVGPVRIDEEDAFGTMVNYAARVVGSIIGAEIWLSDRAYSDIRLERATTHKGLIWRDHKDLVLKGLQGTHTLWGLQQVSKGLRSPTSSTRR